MRAFMELLESQHFSASPVTRAGGGHAIMLGATPENRATVGFAMAWPSRGVLGHEGLKTISPKVKTRPSLCCVLHFGCQD